ncbi:hypothetical protein [Paenibacillus macerans]|uniref:hypothetical protein n=1 Tax=Paenibacillus macerans TaxID=44252 RepID=UPI003D31ABD5
MATAMAMGLVELAMELGMKGVKKLQGLIGRILGKFKFKKFKLERKGKHIRLYGEVNPWVLLADGTIEEVDDL